MNFATQVKRKHNLEIATSDYLKTEVKLECNMCHRRVQGTNRAFQYHLMQYHFVKLEDYEKMFTNQKCINVK